MDLLDILMGSMATEDSVEALSQKTGASKEQAQKLLVTSLPLLVGGMTKNAAASDKGADSLRGALTQHRSTRTAAEQIQEANEEDGEKIVRHIFGDKSDSVVQTLAEQTQINTDQVTRGLASMAPLLLCILSAVTGKAAKFDLSDGLDLTDILALFGGSQQSASNGIGLLGSLLGMGNTQASGNPLGGLMGSMLGSPNQQSSGGLLGSLLGGGSQQNTGSLLGMGSLLGSFLGSPNNSQSIGNINGGDLLSILLGRR